MSHTTQLAHGPSARPDPKRGSTQRQMEAVVGLADGRISRGTVLSFNLQDRILVLNEANRSLSETGALPIPFEQLQFAAFLAEPRRSDPNPSLTRRSRLITLRLTSGELLRGVTETLAGRRPGLFLIPVDADWYERLFVPLSSIRKIVAAVPLDELVQNRPMITRRDVQAAIADPSSAALSRKAVLHSDTDKTEPGETGRQTAPETQIRIGRVLVEQGFLTEAELDDILSRQQQVGDRRLGEVAVEMGLLTYKMIGIALAVQLGIPYTDLSDHWMDPRLLEIVPPATARRLRVVPITLRDDVLTVAVIDPTDTRPVRALRRETGLEIAQTVSSVTDVDRVLRELEPN